MIVAMSKNRVIGKDGDIPWHISEDFKRFKRLTLNSCVVMGRKTYDSLPFKPLPKRENVVLTRSDAQYEGAKVFSDYQEALEYAKGNHEKVFIIGGSAIYQEGLKYADVLELTIINKEVEGDTYFPEFDTDLFVEVSREEHIDEKEGAYAFVTYERKSDYEYSHM